MVTAPPLRLNVPLAPLALESHISPLVVSEPPVMFLVGVKSSLPSHTAAV